MHAALPALLLAAALGACGECAARETAGVARPPPAAAPASAPAPAVAGAAVSAAAAAATSADGEQSPASARPAIALDGEGLRFVDPERGSTRLLAFGSPAPQALAALARLQGRAPVRSVNAECGAGPVEFADWPDGLSILIQEDRFVGWAVDDGASPSGPTTMAGAGVGSTRAELEDAYELKVEQTSLGTEFSAGDVFGLLSSDSPDARVTNLWAGVSCNFR